MNIANGDTFDPEQRISKTTNTAGITQEPPPRNADKPKLSPLNIQKIKDNPSQEITWKKTTLDKESTFS